MRKAPILIRLASYFFMITGVIAMGILAIAWLNPIESSKLSIAFLTNKFQFSEDPILFSLLALFFVFAGITGLGIVTKKSYAYDLGILYSIAGLVFFNLLILLKMGLINSPGTSIVIQVAIFGGFLAYLARHRTEWKNG